MEKAVLARRALDLARDLPADLIVRRDLHPALKDLLMIAAEEVHEAGTLFSPPGRYPARDQTALPLAPEAERFDEDGPPLLQRYLPFWAATFVDRTAILLIPLLTILVPLIRVLPPVVTWQIRSRVHRWCGRLIELESSMASGDARDLEQARRELARIDQEVRRIRVPLAYNYLVYRLCSHLDLVRGRVEELARQAGS